MNDLVAGLRNGDETAVRELYKQYGGAITTVARSIVYSPQLVEEVVQQTFLKAWRSADSFDETREIAPWLYTIARRSAIDALRRERDPMSDIDAVAHQLTSSDPEFDEVYEAFEVRRAVDALPTEERDVVELSHNVGLSHREIGERLGIPMGTVKSRSARAHKRLAAALSHLSAAEVPENSANRSETVHVEEA